MREGRSKLECGMRVLTALQRLPQKWRDDLLWELVEGSEADVIAGMRDDQGGIPDLEKAGELWQALHAFFDAHPPAEAVIDAQPEALRLKP